MKTPTPQLLSVSYAHPAQKKAAEAFASEHDLACQPLHKAQSELTLNFTEMQLEIIDLQNNMTLSVDFVGGSLGHRKKFGGGKGQTIAKAIGIKQGKPIPSVLDATAGLGKDSYVFACLGCPVTLVERSPIVAALVKDGIERASLNIEFSDTTKQGFKLHNCDALEYIHAITEDNKPDVIYLDPMYPEKKKSASVKKNMQILQKLLGHDLDTEEVLKVALEKADKRVVVKRPKGAPELQIGRSPTLKYESKGTRYDVYVI
ncbi:MAG: class I SAM-dependent methyltransferase [Gammaproteobacteria bacterium]|nr:class I SAM-dependent methyltransferase [Gammaproteobacteria bacterium]